MRLAWGDAPVLSERVRPCGGTARSRAARRPIVPLSSNHGVFQEDSIADRAHSAEREADRTGERCGPFTSREGRRRLSPEDLAGDEDLELIRQAFVEEGPDDGAPTFDEQGSDPAGGQMVEQELEVDLLLSAPEYLGRGKCANAILRGDDESRRFPVEDLGPAGRPASRIEDDPKGAPTFRVFPPHGEFWIVHQHGPYSDEDGIRPGPQRVDSS